MPGAGAMWKTGMTNDKGAERCLAFWKKYMRNLIACFENFKAGIRPAIASAGSLAAGRRKYKLAIHMHSLDWYGCDSAPGTIHAMMRYKNYDICALSVKDAAPYNGKLDPAKYSDDKAAFLRTKQQRNKDIAKRNRQRKKNSR